MASADAWAGDTPPSELERRRRLSRVTATRRPAASSPIEVAESVATIVS